MTNTINLIDKVKEDELQGLSEFLKEEDVQEFVFVCKTKDKKYYMRAYTPLEHHTLGLLQQGICLFMEQRFYD